MAPILTQSKTISPTVSQSSASPAGASASVADLGEIKVQTTATNGKVRKIILTLLGVACVSLGLSVDQVD